MWHGTCEGPGTILGGLPVWAVIDHGKDDDTPCGPGEWWSEVRSLHWLKRDGTKGKELPEHITDRAEKYDYAFCDLCEQVFDYVAHEKWLAKQAGEAAQMPPALNDSDGTDLKAWLASIPSFAADWPKGILNADHAAPCTLRARASDLGMAA